MVNTGTGKQVVTVYIDGIFEHSYTKNSGTIDTTRHYNTHRIMDGSSMVATLLVGNDADEDQTLPKKRFYTADRLGTICVTYQENSTLINFEDYYPFGETSYGIYPKQRYRYNGKEKDQDTGLYEYGQRYYAPWLCRFVSVDPIAEKFSQLSSYNYASNRPETARDLEGLQASDEKGDERKRKSGHNIKDGERTQKDVMYEIHNLPENPESGQQARYYYTKGDVREVLWQFDSESGKWGNSLGNWEAHRDGAIKDPSRFWYTPSNYNKKVAKAELEPERSIQKSSSVESKEGNVPVA